MRHLALLVAAGCYNRVPATSVDAPAVDADAPVDAAPQQYCFQPAGLVTICAPLPLRPIYQPTSGRIDTNVITNCDVVVTRGSHRSNELCVMAADAMMIDTPLHAAGSRALVLLSRGSLAVTSVLDADSRLQEPGAGGTATCPSAEQGGDEPSNGLGAGGGAGGSFGTQGANGGDNMASGGTAGQIVASTDVSTFDAGQNGGAGGNLKSGSGGGSCGLGAGGVYLYSETGITVDGTGAVTAFGLGGFGGTNVGGGGGGGGSGGMVVLESPSIMLMTGAVLGATGGGGGGGSSGAALGGQGVQATVATVATPASGGAAQSPAGPGGSASSDPGNPAMAGGQGSSSGGGGGGGGAGVIRIIPPGGPWTGASIYPPPT